MRCSVLAWLMFTFGLLIGSFLNVCSYRLPQNISLIRPPSHCLHCNRRLKLYELVPVASWLMLRGRCRHCKTAVSVRYPAVELVTACLFILCFHELGAGCELVKALILTSFFIVITLIDYDHRLILDKVLACLAGAGILINLPAIHLPGSALGMLLGGLAGGGLLLLIAIASRGGIGGGDIKFAAALGLWLSWQYTLVALLIAFIIGGLGGGLLLAFKIKKPQDYIPFGPFIAAGAWLSLLYGAVLIEGYLTWLR